MKRKDLPALNVGDSVWFFDGVNLPVAETTIQNVHYFNSNGVPTPYSYAFVAKYRTSRSAGRKDLFVRPDEIARLIDSVRRHRNHCNREIERLSPVLAELRAQQATDLERAQ